VRSRTGNLLLLPPLLLPVLTRHSQLATQNSYMNRSCRCLFSGPKARHIPAQAERVPEGRFLPGGVESRGAENPGIGRCRCLFFWFVIPVGNLLVATVVACPYSPLPTRDSKLIHEPPLPLPVFRAERVPDGRFLPGGVESRGPRRAFFARWGGKPGSPTGVLCPVGWKSRGPRRAFFARWGGKAGVQRPPHWSLPLFVLFVCHSRRESAVALVFPDEHGLQPHK
jgi:hypothetical protein